jgi:hypothetical protein
MSNINLKDIPTEVFNEVDTVILVEEDEEGREILTMKGKLSILQEGHRNPVTRMYTHYDEDNRQYSLGEPATNVVNLKVKELTHVYDWNGTFIFKEIVTPTSRYRGETKCA